MKSLQALTLCAAALLAQLAQAADTMAPAPAPAPAAAANPLAAARTLIDARQWAAALTELRRVDDAGNADWNNLMGYVLRKSGNADLAASERHYDAALRIDPHHRNALEYSGELYLMKGELAKAQARLSTLAAECKAGCQQYNELKEAITRYQANGNKYLAQGW
ncbi:Flp pilus assembly protein TadD [Pelomonas saccharophila]|uniref:Flp pilus assembly protein TadD n=1 Tax=Roseateles saccharophilus TaxID=304 RepID=A0ABU1YG15_ROSSA|nr:tetratricopeptide repeat protein [Roseateles saccharophilus]MDR7267798.1 Flp pilus assembly protein TadD [Roseateles saccharophilus]